MKPTNIEIDEKYELPWSEVLDKLGLKYDEIIDVYSEHQNLVIWLERHEK